MLQYFGVITMAYDGIMMHQVKNLLIETIKGGRINKIYQISKYELLFKNGYSIDNKLYKLK